MKSPKVMGMGVFIIFCVVGRVLICGHDDHSGSSGGHGRLAKSIRQSNCAMECPNGRSHFGSTADTFGVHSARKILCEKGF